ncbi:hypothetical protein [Streptomyces sp. NPDC096013]|uniref:hypothetical protein n=1 Tax=Streptomyces sp. NPDC096013 TaxID=3366069 RepID=UPI00381B2F02
MSAHASATLRQRRETITSEPAGHGTAVDYGAGPGRLMVRPASAVGWGNSRRFERGSAADWARHKVWRIDLMKSDRSVLPSSGDNSGSWPRSSPWASASGVL